MKIKVFSLAIAMLFAIACGGTNTGSPTAGANIPKMDIKLNGKDSTFTQKAGGIYKGTKTFTDKEGKVTRALSFYAVMGNFEMDTAKPGWLKAPLTSAEQTRVTIQLIGEENTDSNSELKAGTYKADPTAKFMKVDSLTVTTFADGKQVDTDFETMFSASKITGEVRIKSVTAEEISGEIDITEEDKSVKGTFTAKMPVR